MTRDVIVIGGSAGGVTAVADLVRGLPGDLPAAVLVALHVAPDSRGFLPDILERSGPMPARMASDGAAIRPGRILVAPPNRHLVVEPGVVRLRGGPRINRFRPSIDVLFRSAAAAYGPRVAAVILSGMLDDGAHGLLTVKQNGGVAIVQDTAEALFTGMPFSALDRVAVDHVLRVSEIGPILDELARNRWRGGNGRRESRPVAAKQQAGPSRRAPREARAARPSRRDDGGTDGHWLESGRRSVYGCPDCGGALLESDADGVLRFRCRIGHGYTAESLLLAQDERLEDALWTAVRSLEEAAATKQRMAARVASSGATRIAAEYEQRAVAALAHAATIREILDRGIVFGTEPAVSADEPKLSTNGSRTRSGRKPARHG